MNMQISAVANQRTSPRMAPMNAVPPARARCLDLEQVRAHVDVLRYRLEPGDYLYRAGQPFRSIFIVRVGSLKTCELAADGREQVTGFRMSGEMVGVESIGLKTYACDVIALESCEVWELPYPPVLTACLRLPELQMSLTE